MHRKLLEDLSRFTYYKIENLEIYNDTINFDYLSIIKDIICNCELNNNYVKIYISNSELSDSIKSDDLMIDICKLASIWEYIDKLKISRYRINRTDSGIYFKYIVKEFNIDNAKEVVKLIDRILLNCCLIADNKKKVGLNRLICIYPDVYNEINGICLDYIVYNKIQKYIGYTHWVNLKYQKDGYKLSIENCDKHVEIINITDIKIVDIIQYNNNLYQALNILKEINLNNGFKLVIDNYKIKLITDDTVNCNLLYLNIWIDIEDNMVGKLVGNTCTMNYYITIDGIYLIIKEK